MKKVAIFVDVDWETIPQYMQMEKIQIISNDIHKKIYKKTNYFKFDNNEHVLSLIKSPVEANEEIYQIFFYSSMPISFKKRLEQLEDTVSMTIEYIEEELQDKEKPKYKNCADKLLKKYLTIYKQEYPKKFEEIEKVVDGIKKNHVFLKNQDYFKIRLCQQEINFKYFSPQARIFVLEQRTHKWNNMLAFGLDVAHISYKRLVDTIIVFSRDINIIPALQCAKNNDRVVRLVGIKESEKTMPEEIREYADEFKEISLYNVIDRKKAPVMAF